MSPLRLPWNPLDDLDSQVRASLGRSETQELLDAIAHTELQRRALISRLRLLKGAASLADPWSDPGADDASRREAFEQLWNAS